MPRINRKIRVRPQNRVTRAQILELLIGPNGKSVFASAEEARALWAQVEQQYSPAFAAQWHAARGRVKPFAEIAEQYARDVVEGRIDACQWTKLACQRHLSDLESGGGPYLFDVARAERVCRFLELLPHVKGGWAANAELMVLQPWQIFIVCVLFGWIKAATGARRFSLAYIQVPRKNGKSFLAAGIGLYMTACDSEFGAEVYSGATTEKQAYEVFLPARQMIERTSELGQALGLVPAAKKIKRPEDGSRFEVLIGKPGDGASPSCGIVDEYHEHASEEQFSTLRTGMGARPQPLLLVITTAGDNTAGPCKLLHDDVCEILAGKFERPEVFGIVYTLDRGDSWADPAALVKANPNLGVSVSREFLETEQKAAVLNPRQQGVFCTKHCNVWMGAVAGYFDVYRWGLLADPKLDIDDFVGLPCVLAGDLSTKRDFTARVATFKKADSRGRDHYYVFSRFYLPEDQVNRPEAPHYREWAAGGWIRVHEGGTVDFDAITQETIDEANRLEVIEFAFDPWNAAPLAQAVAKHTRAEAIEMLQVPKVLSPPMKELASLIVEGRIHHDGNPVLAWMIGNVTAREDVNENVLPRKGAGREENKIDGAVALIMAIARIQAAEENTVSYTGLHCVAC